MQFLIFGHGYTASELTPRLSARGWTVTGTTRTDPDRVAKSGAAALLWPGDHAAVSRAIAAADAILISVAPAPDGAADPVIAEFHAELLAARPRWIGYLSSTNVYGDHGGAWVDETTPATPDMPRAQARLQAEREWSNLSARAGWPLSIFRLAGIYGPGRGPFEKLRRGTARRIVKPGQVFSRIHVEDIAGAILASLDMPAPRGETQILNVCDDQPAPPQDVIAAAANMLCIPVPRAEDFDAAQMSPMARSFYADSKRVRNARMKTDLGYQLRYPDYHSGLAAILDTEG